MKKLNIDKEYLIVIVIAIIVLCPFLMVLFNFSLCPLFCPIGGCGPLCDFTGIFNGIIYEHFNLFDSIEYGRWFYCYGNNCIVQKTSIIIILMAAFFIAILFTIFLYKKFKHKKKK